MNIIYEDNNLLILNKPQGLATSPGKQKSLCDVLFQERPELIKVQGYKEGEGGLLNRLDNETGGLVMFAKSNDAFKYYSQLMKAGKIKKKYKAIVQGKILQSSGIINTPIAHHQKSKKKMVTGKGRHRGQWREAVTKWKLLGYKGEDSVLDIEITKGARHQIRVHLAHLGYPVVDDKLYSGVTKGESGKGAKETNYQQLWAYGLEFVDIEGKKREIVEREIC